MPDSATTRRAESRENTRDRIIALLRRGPHTVEDLARAVGLTDNGVRMHLIGLEQSGTIRQSGVLRTGKAGKPASIYEITPEAAVAFSRAYVPILVELVSVLGEQLPPDQLIELMRETGRRLAAGASLPGELEERLRAAVDLLNQLGAIASIEAARNEFTVQGIGCPLSAAVARCPEVCTAVEVLLAELTGGLVTQLCHHGDQPACRFTVRNRGQERV